MALGSTVEQASRIELPGREKVHDILSPFDTMHECDISRRDHITPILRQLHWLPVRRRVDFKIAVLVFQCLTGQAPGYLAEDCQLVADVSVRRLRSADTATCVTHRTSNIFGDRCFAAAGPRL